MPIVVKLGGSLAGTALLDAWLAALAALAGSGRPCVIVPGGGVFADAVRAAQGPMGFDDCTAHHMALLAMAQFGHVLASRCARCRLAATAAEIAAALDAGKMPVWLSSAMAGEAVDIPQNWAVTSDSLAAWLAGRIGARQLLLVKQVDSVAASVTALVAGGIVDPAFPGFLARSGARAWIAGPGDLAGAPASLAKGDVPGLPITLP